MSWARPAGGALFALSGAVLATIGLVLAIAPPGWSIGTLAGDDAGYYFAIARNVCLGHGFSFDRLHPTNGFNPLFPWLLIPAYRLLPGEPSLVACYRVGVLAGFAANLIALGALLRILAASLDPRAFPDGLRRLALASGAAFFALFLATKSYYGMDAPLVLMLGLIYTWRTLRGGPLAPGAAAAATDGLLLGLLFLARVDTLPLVLAAFVVMGCEWAARRGGGGALAGRLAVTAIVCLPYLVWSTLGFGTWLPVSARLKSSFPVIDLAGSLQVIRHSSLHVVDQASFLVAGLLAVIVAAGFARHAARAWRAREPLDPGRAALATLALYLIGRLAYMLLFSRADVQGSYAILAHPFNLLVVATAIGDLAARRADLGRRAGAWAGVALGALALLLFAGKVEATAARWRQSAERRIPDEASLGREIHDLTRSGDVLYGGAFGMLGFFADRPWINLDGVVNTYDYQQVFLAPGSRGRGGLEDYLGSNRVTHVVFTTARDASLGAEPIRMSVLGIQHGRVNWFPVWPADILLQRPSVRGPVGGGTIVVARFRP